MVYAVSLFGKPQEHHLVCWGISSRRPQSAQSSLKRQLKCAWNGYSSIQGQTILPLQTRDNINQNPTLLKNLRSLSLDVHHTKSNQGRCTDQLFLRFPPQCPRCRLSLLLHRQTVSWLQCRFHRCHCKMTAPNLQWDSSNQNILIMLKCSWY